MSKDIKTNLQNAKIKHPKILCLNENYNVINSLSERYDVVYDGRINLQDNSVLGQNYVPRNYIEFDLLICNLQYVQYSEYDEAVYRAAAHSLNYFIDSFNDNGRHSKLEIIFCGVDDILYRFQNGFSFNTYYFLNFPIHLINRKGHEVFIDPKWKFLEKYKENFSFFVAFDKSKNNKEEIQPLLYERTGFCVGFLFFDGKITKVVLPEVDDIHVNSKLIDEIIENIGLTYVAELFPEQINKDWFQDRYYPDDVQNLIMEKSSIIEDYENKIHQIDLQLSQTKEKYHFLRSVLMSDGEELVFAVKKLLEELGLKNIICVDNEKDYGEDKEEDLRIDSFGLEHERLVFEIKGLTGTSKDSDCSQIDKIVTRWLRRARSKNTHGVYIVNYQKNLSLDKRKTDPFSSNQKADAFSSERTMMTTPFLYCLYLSLRKGWIAQEKLNSLLLKSGVIDSISDESDYIGTVSEYFKKPNACIIQDIKYGLNIGQRVALNKNGLWCITEIKSLQINDKTVNEVQSGQDVGMVINSDFIPNKGTRVYRSV